MKTNYDFPYQFCDYTNEGFHYLETKLEDTELLFLIDLGEFESNQNLDVILEVESSQTFYRKMFVLSENKSTVKIEYDQLGSKVEYSILLVSKKEGNIEINEQSDFYEIGDCVGVLEKNRLTLEEEEGFSGLIKIAHTTKDTIAYDLTSDWITIELPKETYLRFIPWHNDDKNTPFALASLGNSCIQFAIIKALNQEEYKEKKWWETITKLLTDNGYDVDDLGEDEIPGAANKILGNCIQSMVNAATPDVEHGDTSILA